ncbi:MAG: Maltose transport system permease protein MalF [Actinomycetota bacterium]
MSAQKPDTKYKKANRVAAMYNGGAPTLRGTVFKIILLAIVDAIAFFAAMVLVAAHRWDYLAGLVLVALVMNWIYLRKGGLPAKYLAPGVLFLMAFSVSVVFFSGFISFTNYGGQHNDTKAEAIDSIKLGANVLDTNAPWMEAAIVEDSAKNLYVLASDLNDPANPHYYFGGEKFSGATAWHEIDQTSDEFTKVTLGTSVAFTDPVTFMPLETAAVSIDGYRTLTADEKTADGARLSTIKFPLGADIVADGWMAIDTSGGGNGVQRTYYDAVYDAKTDSFTRQSDGAVFKANESTGFFDRGKVGSPDYERLSDTGWQVVVGFSNYAKIFGNEQLRAPLLKIFTWTVIFALASVLSTFVVGLALALLFNDDRLRGKKIYRSIMILPYAFPAFLSAYVWKGMFSTDYGFINFSILHAEPGKGIPWLSEEGPAKWAVLLCNLWLGFPYMFLICTGALQAIPGELTESATIDGATGWQQFRLIKLPLLLISLAPLLISSFAFNFNNFSIIYLITGGGPAGDPALGVDAGGTDILISFVYKIAFSSSQGADYGLASAFSVLIFFIVGGMSMLTFRRTKFLEDLA